MQRRRRVDAAFTAQAGGQSRAAGVHGMAMHSAKPQPCETSPPGSAAQIAASNRRMARSLYWRGWTVKDIAQELDLNAGTVRSWKRRDAWHKAAPVDVVEDRLEAKIATYLDKEPFTEGDMKRVDFLTRQMERAARIRKFGETGKDGDLNPKISRRNDDAAKAKRAEKRKNHLTIEQWQDLLDDFHTHNFDHQQVWWDQREQRTRKILKGRQIGATWYFAREALAKVGEAVIAAHEGRPAEGRTFAHAQPWQPRNQIFLSASKRQSMKFRREIVGWVKKVTGVELKGDPIMFDLTGLEDEAGDPLTFEPVGLYPLSTNSATAQGESGDFYFDEYFWVPGFAELRKVAAAMSTHKIYKRTFFSTPSTKTHEAYAFWSGEQWNRGKAKNRQKTFDLAHRHLRGGAIMPDGAWQQIVTLDDALRDPNFAKLIDVEELRTESSEEEFSNLYGCEFMDDSQSSFPWSRIAPARVDSFYQWRDFTPALLDVPGGRPFGDAPVWIGYDPNKQGRDDAALVVVAPPSDPGVGKFRILDKYRLNDLDFQGQADFIQKIAEKYTVSDISIDTTGSGQAVFEIVKRWFPTARRIEYNVASKTALVIKGQSLFRNGRVEFDTDWTDLMQAFIAIRPAQTASGKTVTYVAARGGQVGHADLAWACLHAFSNEPIDVAVAANRGGGRVVISE